MGEFLYEIYGKRVFIFKILLLFLVLGKNKILSGVGMFFNRSKRFLVLFFYIIGFCFRE